MKYKVLNVFKAQTKQGEMEVQEGQVVTLPDHLAVMLIGKGKVTPIEPFSVTSWLEKLSDSEIDIYKERAAIMQIDGGLPRERAEVEAIKRIIQERMNHGMPL